MENYYISWTEYGPIIVQSKNQVEEKRAVQDVSLEQSQCSSNLEHNRSYTHDPDIEEDSSSTQRRIDDPSYPNIKTTTYDIPNDGTNNEIRGHHVIRVSDKNHDNEANRMTEQLKPSTSKDNGQKSHGGLELGTSNELQPQIITNDLQFRRLSFAEPPMTSSKRASLDVTAMERRAQRRLSLRDAQPRRSSMVESASRRSSFLEVPLPEGQRKKLRRGSAQIPTGAIMDKKSREKLLQFVFKDDPEFLLLEIPEAEPPKRRLRQVDLKKFFKIDDHTEQIPYACEREFDEIVSYLSSSPEVRTQLQLARAIYHYLSTRTFNEVPAFDRLQELTPLAFFSAIKNGAISLYTLVFEILCRYASIPCVTIEGWVKPKNFAPENKLGDHCIHAWNAAYLDGEWFLFDLAFASSEADPLKFPSSRTSSRASSTRSVASNSNIRANSSYLNQRRDSVASQTSSISGHDKRGSWSSTSSNSSEVSMNFGTAEDYYFCPVPEDFVFSHFPFESKWQLLQANDCLTKRSFEKLAVIRDEFFMMGLNVTEETHFTTTVKSKTGSTKFVYRLPISFVLQFKVTLICVRGLLAGQEVSDFVFFYRDQTKIVFETRITVSGHFVVSLFCRHNPGDDFFDEEDDFSTFCEFACYRLICNLDDSTTNGKILNADRIVNEDTKLLLGPQRTAMESLKLSFIDHESGYFIAHNSGNLVIRIYGAEPLDFKFDLRKDNESYRRYCSLVLGDADDRNHTYFRCRFPQTGEYFLKLYGRNPAVDDQWQMFSFYMIKVNHASKRKNHTPKFNSSYFGLSPLIDRSLLVSHQNPYFTSKTNQIILTFYSEDFFQEIRMNFFYFDVSQGSKGQLVNVNNLMFYDRYLLQKRHLQCEIEMITPGVHILEVFRRQRVTKKVPKPRDSDEEIMSILDEIERVPEGSEHSFAGPEPPEEEMVEKTEIEENYLITYGIDYVGEEIPNSEVNEFPDILPDWTPSCKLFEPRLRFLPALKTTHFRLAVPWAKKVKIKGRSVTELEREHSGTFSFDILVGMYCEHIIVQAVPFSTPDSSEGENEDETVDLLRFEVDFGNIEMADADELGRVQKQVQEAIDLAWLHLGQVSALEKEVAILESKQIRDTDGLYEHAKKLIPFFKIRERLVIAMSNMAYDELKSCLREIDQNEEYQNWLELEYPRAKRLFRQMTSRLQMKNRKRELNQTCVTEIRRFNNPQFLLHQVMMGVFALLGYPMNAIKKWDFIRKEMGKPGREGTLFKIQSCKPSTIQIQQANLAQRIFSSIDEKEVKNLTSSAAAFYEWGLKTLKRFEKYQNGEEEEEEISAKSSQKPPHSAKKSGQKEKENLFEDATIQELIEDGLGTGRPSTTQSSRTERTTFPLGYDDDAVKTVVSQSRPRTAISATRSRPSTRETERIILNEGFDSDLATASPLESRRIPDTNDTTPREPEPLESKTESQPQEDVVKEEKAIPIPGEGPQSNEKLEKVGKLLRPPPTADSLPSIISKQSRHEEPISSGRVKEGALLHVILSDDVQEVGVDEVDEIQERRRQQRAFSQRQIPPMATSNRLAPPQLEHEVLMQKLDNLAASTSNGRSTLQPLPSTVIIPPTPLQRVASSHSLTSNISEGNSQNTPTKTSTSREN